MGEMPNALVGNGRTETTMTIMDEAERKRFLDTLRSDDEFRATVRRELLTQELLDLPQTVAALVDMVAQQRQDFTDLARDVRAFMEVVVSGIQSGFAEVQSGFAEVQSGFAEVQSGFAEVQSGLAEVQSGLAEAKSGLAEVKSGLVELRTDMEAGFIAVDAKFDQVNSEIRDIKDRLAS